MQSTTLTATVGTRRLWIGRIMSTLAVLFLLFDSIVKILGLPVAVDATTELGYRVGIVGGIGILELICLLIYVVPRTATLGAVLLTGYLGGAVASQLRVGHPLFSHVLFPIYVAVFIWGGLFIRDGRLRALVALPD
jgi:hypothetical protein